MSNAHPIPPAIADALHPHPAKVKTRLLEIRELIFQASEDTGTGPLTETLKWGEPAYLTEASKSGTTIRLGRTRNHNAPAVLFNCNTSLVADFREQFADVLQFDGNRALLLDTEGPLPVDALAICLGRALTYHRDKRKVRA